MSVDGDEAAAAMAAVAIDVGDEEGVGVRMRHSDSFMSGTPPNRSELFVR